MRIFLSFLIIVVAAILFMLPLTEASYDFRTDVRSDSYTLSTSPAITASNVTLHKPLYDNDTQTVTVFSYLATDNIAAVSYNSTTRLLELSGLVDNVTRLVDVSYDIDALGASGAISNLIDKVPWIWLLSIIAFPVAALFAIFTGRV